MAMGFTLSIYSARIKRVSRTFSHTWTTDIDILMSAVICGTKVARQNSPTFHHFNSQWQCNPALRASIAAIDIMSKYIQSFSRLDIGFLTIYLHRGPSDGGARSEKSNFNAV